MNDIGKLIFNHRHQQGMRQVDLGEKVGVSASYISHVEAGRRTPNATLLAKIANALGCELELKLGDRRG